MRTAFAEELLELANADSRVWLITGDLGYSVLERFAERFPDRYLNVGVAEQAMVGIAAGLAHSGALVFVYSIANFPTFRCLEQIRNDVCYSGASVTIVSIGSGFSYGSHGYTHHAIEDLGIMRSLPGIAVVSPADPGETRMATRALAARGGPGYLRLGKAGEAAITVDDAEGFSLGSLRCVRNGMDVTLIGAGSVMAIVMEAAEELGRLGIDTRVYSAHTLKPFDAETLRIASSETAGIVTVEEHRLIGGLRSAVAEALMEGMDSDTTWRVQCLGVDPDVVHGTGDQDYLRKASGITVERIADAARAICAK